MAHKWADWLHNPCCLGVWGGYFRARGKIRSDFAPWPTSWQIGYITLAVLGGPQCFRARYSGHWIDPIFPQTRNDPQFPSFPPIFPWQPSPAPPPLRACALLPPQTMFFLNISGPNSPSFPPKIQKIPQLDPMFPHFSWVGLFQGWCAANATETGTSEPCCAHTLSPPAIKTA